MAATPNKVDIKDAGGTTVEMRTMKDGTVHRPVHVLAREGDIGRTQRQYMDTTGDGTGTKNAIGDYSLSATNFRLLPASGTIYLVDALGILIADGSTPLGDAYGAMSVLATGIKLEKWDGLATVDDLTNGVLIKRNRDWGVHANDGFQDHTYGGVLSEYSLAFHIRFPQPIRLIGTDTEELRLVLNDNFSGLLQHYFLASYVKESELV